jgi:hypothetical protein
MSSSFLENVLLSISYSLDKNIVNIIIEYLRFEYFHSCQVIKSAGIYYQSISKILVYDNKLYALNTGDYVEKIIIYNIFKSIINIIAIPNMAKSFSLVDDKIYFSANSNIYSCDFNGNKKREFEFKNGSIDDFIINDNNIFVLSNRALYYNNNYFYNVLAFTIHNDNLFILSVRSLELCMTICNKKDFSIIKEYRYGISCYNFIYGHFNFVYNEGLLLTKIGQYIIIFNEQNNSFKILNINTKKFSSYFDEPFNFETPRGFNIIKKSLYFCSKGELLELKYY